MSEFWFSVIPYQGPTAFLTNLTRFSANHNEPESLIERGRGDFYFVLVEKFKMEVNESSQKQYF